MHPETNAVLVERNELITESIAEKIIDAGIEEVEIRSVLTCNTHNGVCCKCYGRNLATGNIVEIGEAIGVMAAQSIGEPGTQLNNAVLSILVVLLVEKILLKVYHVFKNCLKLEIQKEKQLLQEISGKVSKIVEDHGKFKISVKNDLETKEHVTNYGAKLRVQKAML